MGAYHGLVPFIIKDDAEMKFRKELHFCLHLFLSLLCFLASIPYLQIRIPGAEKQRDPVLSFGSVAVGKSSQKQFEIFNPCAVIHTAIRVHPRATVNVL